MLQVPKSQLSLAGEQVEDEAGCFITCRDRECQVNMLKSLDHPHIVRVFEARAPHWSEQAMCQAFESEQSLHIVMDYAEGGLPNLSA